MAAVKQNKQNSIRWWFPLVVGALGAGFQVLPVGDPLQEASYDIPFLFSTPPYLDEVVIVFMDEKSVGQLGQSFNKIDRDLYRQLIERLDQEGARLIFFDIAFLEPWEDPVVDQRFAEAIRRHGNVILGGILDSESYVQTLDIVLKEPVDILKEASLDWGLLTFGRIGGDLSVRRLWTGSPDVPTATWQAAVHWLGDGASLGDRMQERWVYHYGEAGIIPKVPFANVLDPAGVPKDFFKGKAVFVGARPEAGPFNAAKDEFSTPFTRFTHKMVPGVEVHATAFLNLIRGEWITRPGLTHQSILTAIGGFLIAWMLFRLRPGRATLAAIGLALLITLAGLAIQIEGQLWIGWLVPIAVLIPLALGGSVINQYWIEARQRAHLREAFSAYVSPQLADRLVQQQVSLEPGGEEMHCTILFSDLENFTNLSETLSPEALSRELNRYFDRATDAIYDQEGTVIKFIGDAVLAVWGAPLPDERQTDRALRAARDVALHGTLKTDQMICRTRVGIHTGPVVAGNLGSRRRFDYTVIGDAVNLAARLEGMNKMLGTSVLVSGDTRSQLTEEHVLRSMGKFRVKGKQLPVEVFELVCEEKGLNYDLFQSALDAFQKGAWETAEGLFQQVIEKREGGDPPSGYFLRYMAADYFNVVPEGWEGVVNLTSK